MPPLFLKSRRKPKLVRDENCAMRNSVKPYINEFNATDFVSPGTPDLELLETTEKNNLKIITQDIRFVLETLSREKSIIYQNRHGVRILVKPKIIQTDCNDKKYKCPITLHILYSDEVIRA